ncbi:MAG: endolytic transglycosylase MltG [Muribaculaceae bacterium]|nr:endolytic transglycosylase MltG [Muribaculaceae bacterium]
MIKRLIYIFATLIVVGGVLAWWCYKYATVQYEYEAVRVNIGAALDANSIEKLLCDSLGQEYGTHVGTIWKLRGGNAARAHGSYLVKPGETAFKLAMRLRGGAQDPINVTVPNLRSTDRVIEAIASNFEFSTDSLRAAFNEMLAEKDIDQRYLPAFILPDTYQYYWTMKPEAFVASIYKQWENYWTETRRAKSAKLGLTPIEVSTLASIVEEESAKADERPIIARLYLNRLSKHMKLQADPTVKYAVGDPTLKRILNVHLTTPSPYNTYIIDGLPPSPLRVVDKQTLGAVLDAPEHNYLYMCAKEDFSGYHNFAKTNAEHAANARRYHAALNQRNIK